MSDGERVYGREGAALEGQLSEAEKARIRAEETYRAQVRAEAEKAASAPAPAPAPTLEELQEQRRARQEEKRQQRELKRQEQQRKADELSAQQKEEWESMSPGKKLFARVLIGVIAATFLFAAFTMWKGRATLASPSGPKPVSEMSGYSVESLCQDEVRSLLKAPSTAKFVSGSDAVWSNSSWVYTGAVEAQNSFGVPVRTSFVCNVDGNSADEAVATVNLLE